MHVLVIGPGAVGLAFGVLAEKSGHTVYFQSRQAAEGDVQIHFPEFNQTETLNSPNIHPEPSQFFKPPALDVIIISLKTTENHLLETLLAQHTITSNTVVLILQNGIGNEEFVASLLPNNPIVASVTDIAAVRDDVRTVTVKRLGLLKLAPLREAQRDAIQQIKALFANAPVSVAIAERDSHKQIRWEKLLWNIPFNSLSTLCRVPASHLLANESSEAFVRSLMLEVIQIAKSHGAHIEPSAIDTLFAATRKLGEYKPSMYTHFLNGQALESEYIIQNALNIAERNHVDTPHLSFVSECIHRQPIPELSANDLSLTRTNPAP